MKKVFIDGASFAHRSLGHREMSVTSVMILKKAIPDLECTILSVNPAEENSQCTKWHFKLRVLKRGQSFFGAIPYLLLEYLRADLIVGVYGDGFTGRDHLRNSVLLSKLYIDFIVKLSMINLTRKPFIILPSSIGPFNRSFSKFFVRHLLNGAKLIMVREEDSKQYLLNMGVNKSLIKEMPDMAFIMPKASIKLGRINLGNKNLLIGINISQLISSESKNYITLMAKLSDYLTTHLSATVILVPHEIVLKNVLDPPSHSQRIGGDDITAVSDVYGKVINKKNVVALTDRYECDQIKGIIAQCDLFIGARTHSIIAALSMGVPTIGIAYSHKTPGIMKMMGLEEYVLDFRSLDLERLKTKFSLLMANRNSIHRNLLSKSKDLKNRIWTIPDVITAVINDFKEYL